MIRTPAHPIEPIFPRRWSARAMSGQPVERAELLRLFEAARWSPSCANSQPWRFVYGLAGTPAFAPLFDLLDEGNRAWCVRAGALVLVCSRATMDNGKPSPTPSFDTGAAWLAVALQGTTQGLVVHGMAGFDYARAPGAAGLPDGHKVECMVAVGHPGRVDDLPERQRPREQPSDRRPVESFAFEGRFPA